MSHGICKSRFSIGHRTPRFADVPWKMTGNSGFKIPFPMPLKPDYSATKNLATNRNVTQIAKPISPITPDTTKQYHPTRHKLGIAPHAGQTTARRLMAVWQSEHFVSDGSGAGRACGSGGRGALGGTNSVVSMWQCGHSTVLPASAGRNWIG